MKDDPSNSGATAVILDREQYTNDIDAYSTTYFRIKILKAEGVKYGNIEIPFIKELNRVANVRARTIRPDGSSVDFNGEVFEKIIIKARTIRLLTKTFTLPEVTPGSIVEYKYRLVSNFPLPSPPRWDIQEDLFTIHAHFTLVPFKGLGVLWYSYGLPANLRPVQTKSGTFELDLGNIRGLETEDYMPPIGALKARVQFFYTVASADELKSPEAFWKKQALVRFNQLKEFIGRPKAFEPEVQEITSGTATREAALRKIYTRVQRIRNLSYERGQSAGQLKENTHAQDVWKHQYGYASEIVKLFVAMARAAGFDATVVRVADRDDTLFEPKLYDWSQMRGEVAEVRISDQVLYLDPGTPFCPFGSLPWERTLTSGVRYTKDGEVFVNVPLPKEPGSVTKRKAALEMAENGETTGRLEVSFSGREALDLRRAGHDVDEVRRRKYLINEARQWLPGNATVELASAKGWDDPEAPLEAVYEIKFPIITSTAGRRAFVPLAIFQYGQKHPFQYSRRVQAVLFPHTSLETDEIELRVPAAYQVENLPKAQAIAPNYAEYKIDYNNQSGALHVKRTFRLNNLFYKAENYPTLRAFYDAVQASDEQQAVLQWNKPAALK